MAQSNVHAGVNPTWVFTPASGTAGTLRLLNESSVPAYAGGPGVTPASGVPVAPGRMVRLQHVTSPVYVVSGVTAGPQAATASSAAVTAGSTVLPLSAGVPAALTAGSAVIVGTPAGTGWEAQVIASTAPAGTTPSSQLTFAGPLSCDHAGGAPVYLASWTPAQLRVTAGTG